MAPEGYRSQVSHDAREDAAHEDPTPANRYGFAVVPRGTGRIRIEPDGMEIVDSR